MKIPLGNILVCLLILLPNCSKKAALIDADYVGVWDGNNGSGRYHISIDNDSRGYWIKTVNGCTESERGVAYINRGKLHIGLRCFSIDLTPSVDSNLVGTMILSGVTYNK